MPPKGKHPDFHRPFAYLIFQWLTCVVTVSSQWQLEPRLEEREIHSYSYYLMEVEHKYGIGQGKKLTEILARKPCPKGTVLLLLQQMYRGKWLLDEAGLVFGALQLSDLS